MVESEKDRSRHSLSQENLSFEKHENASETEREPVEAVEERSVTEKHQDTYEAQNDLESGELERHLSRKSSKKDQMANEKYPLIDLDKGLVGWESQDDPLNPRNFPERHKWTLMAFVSAITFLTPLTSSIFAPGVSFMSKQFHNTSEILASFSVSVFVLGFAFGPLFLSPLSEIYGRQIVLNASNLFFCCFSLGCALAPNLAGLIVMRFLAGTGASACLTIGSGVISDLFLPQQRGLATAVYAMGILFGPIMGPVIGGFIAQRAGWRWDFWVVFIAACVITGGIIIFNKETNPVVLMEWKTKRLQKETGRAELKNVYNAEKDAAALSPIRVLRHGVVRPLKLLFTSPIVFLLSLYLSFVFGLLYLLFTTITQVYVGTYGWSPELTGLAYLGVGLGSFTAIVFVARTSDATIIRLTKRNNNVYEPEMRLPTTVFFGFLIPISFFWYGWATDKHAHWIVPIIGLFPFGLGMMGIFAPIQTYLIDSFPMHAASAVAGLTALRCLFGAVLPLAGPSMYDSLGLGWGNSLLGFVAVGMIPFPALIYKYGGMIRKKYPVKL